MAWGPKAHGQHRKWRSIDAWTQGMSRSTTMSPSHAAHLADSQFSSHMSSYLPTPPHTSQVLSDLDSMNIEDSPTLFDQQV
jgi:hypothetical protein